MTQDLDLSITICSWNTREDLRHCLQSLKKERDSASFEVIVWDNASEDGSAEMVEKEFPWVRLIRSPENVGFSIGHNRATECARGSLLLILNSDTIVHPGALKKIIDYMKAHPDVAILGPKLLNPDGSLQYSCRRFPTPMAALFRNTPLGKLFPRNPFLREYLMQDWAHDEIREVDWVSGAAMCFQKEAWKKLKGFDEQFFMYMEDVDICYRAWQEGMRVVYFPQAVITHAIGRSTDRVANKMIRLFHKSMFLFYKKNYMPKIPALLRPFA
ncbi:MAG: glycosyltransferase family 2 protein, partial [Fimbriimonadales bacterium]|nr:glycosyltransferase family 2 protein [Fimbriimonadales bacterium]